MTPKAYSLWLQPAGPLAERLQQEIIYLADAYGGPVFEPHVTLVPGFEAVDDEAAKRAAQSVARALKKYRIRFQKPSYGSTFHQCVYILCAPEADVLHASTKAKQLLGLSDGGGYMPHVSVLYAPVDERIRRSVAELEERRLFEGSNGLDLGFDVDSLTVWSTDPADTSLESWKKLGEFPFQQ